MKEVLIIFFILLIIIFGNLYINKYLNKSAKALLNDLDNLKNNIEQQNISQNDLIQESEDLYIHWGEINKKWSNIILHEEIDSIETALIRTKSKIKMEKNDECLEDINTAIFLVNHITEKEKTSLKNIF